MQHDICSTCAGIFATADEQRYFSYDQFIIPVLDLFLISVCNNIPYSITGGHYFDIGRLHRYVADEFILQTNSLCVCLL